MAASTAGALKAFLEGQSLGISVYRDEAPKDKPPAYITIKEMVAFKPVLLEDGAASSGVETVQVDVWMQWKNYNATPVTLTESYTLPSAVAKALQGAQLPVAPTRAYLVLVRLIGPRLLEQEENIVHVPITIDIHRNL